MRRAAVGSGRRRTPTRLGGEGERYVDSPRGEVLGLVPPAASVLDVGCFKGAFGEALKRARPGTSVWGVEPDEEACAVARTRLDRAVCGTFPEALPAGARFDLVTFLDVLEHLVDPWEALRSASGLLNPGGAVLATLPNVRHVAVVLPLVARGRWRYAESGLLDRTHLRFFTREAMGELFDEAGYEVERIEAINLSGGKTGAVLRLGGRAAEQFRALQYAVVATPAAGVGDEVRAPGR